MSDSLKDIVEIKINGLSISINKHFCKGCGICIEMCPTKVFEWSEKLSEKGVYFPVPSYIDKCTKCRRCELMCPDFAISVEVEEGAG
ncbi:ferredoxin family protein [Archaeoglobales archaeon]|nr:MAG: ferredoxin family protein [Archaeoglobales archaeon]